MDVRVLNTNFELVGIIDRYETFIWTERYSECGDFELHLLMDVRYLDLLRINYYLQINDSDRLMIIEKLEIHEHATGGDSLKVSGRSLEVLLDRRIIAKQITFSGKIQNGIKKILKNNLISPSDDNRKIDNFIFEETDDPLIDTFEIDAQFDGETLYSTVKQICDLYEVGFKVRFTADKKFAFSIYDGVDRSYDQVINPRMIFSPEFDNIISSDYSADVSTLRTNAIVAGEGEGSNRERVTVSAYDPEVTGILRRETYVDAGSVSSKTDDGDLTAEQYRQLLAQKGMEELTKNIVTESFDCETVAVGQYVYRRDYNVGDVVQVETKYGILRKMRIVEVIRAQSETGYSVYPTFAFIE